MARIYLPQCEVCRHYETCVKEDIDRKSISCMTNFYVDDFAWDYYSKHLSEYAVSEFDLATELALDRYKKGKFKTMTKEEFLEEMEKW